MSDIKKKFLDILFEPSTEDDEAELTKYTNIFNIHSSSDYIGRYPFAHMNFTKYGNLMSYDLLEENEYYNSLFKHDFYGNSAENIAKIDAAFKHLCPSRESVYEFITTVDENYDEFLKDFANKEIHYVTRYSKKVYSTFDFSDLKKDVYLMFGKESTGIPHDILRAHMEHVFRIPMVPEARSLNLSNCVALVAYEVLRQQQFPNLATHEAIKGEDFLFKELKKRND